MCLPGLEHGRICVYIFYIIRKVSANDEKIARIADKFFSDWQNIGRLKVPLGFEQKKCSPPGFFFISNINILI